MAPLFNLISYFALAQSALAATVTLNWDLGYVNGINPDGELSRRVIGINGQWPNPTINVNVGDVLTVNVNNKIPDQYTSIHWHGLYQAGTNAMDGPPGAVQCEIAPGQSFTYTFNIAQPGTYWYHSHSPVQYVDGLRGPLIVHDPQAPFKYDSELVVTLSDWYHDEAPGLVAHYMDPAQNPSGAEPVPYSALMNDGQNIKLNVKPNKTYYLRLINISGFAQLYYHLDGHSLTIVEIDGVYTVPTTVDSLYIALGQRYGVILKTKPDASTNYAMLGMLDQTKFDNVPAYQNPNVTGYLIYDGTKPLPSPVNAASFNVIDDFTLQPLDQQKLLPSPSQTITLGLSFFEQDGQNRAGFNNITYLQQKVPTLMTALSAGKDAANPVIYGQNTQSFVLLQGRVYDIVVNNYDGGSHPMHIHGHAPQMIARQDGVYTPGPKHKKPRPHTLWNGNTNALPAVPMRRDTWMVAPAGYTVLRFRAMNPGVWILHCHMDWHVDAGLTATLVTEPKQLQKQQTIPAQSLANCKAQGIPTVGNAAGNSKNFLDLTGQITTCPALPARGALV